jgi:signal transduction histidine kinase
MATVVIVGAHNGSCESLAEILSVDGHRVLTASDASEALSLACAHRPAIVIDDATVTPTDLLLELVGRLTEGNGDAPSHAIDEARALTEPSALTLLPGISAQPSTLRRSTEELVASMLRGRRPALSPARSRLGTLADHVARRIAGLEGANRALTALLDAGRRLLAERDPDALLRRACEAARDLVGAGYAATAMLDEGRTTVRRFVASGIDTATDPTSSRRDLVTAAIDGPGAGHGMLQVAHKSGGAEFTDEDARLVATLCEQIAVSYDAAVRTAGLDARVVELEGKIARLTDTNAQLETFGSVISHDLKNPLVLISTCAQLLEQRCAAGLDAEAREYVERIGAASLSMNGMIDDLLEYSRVDRAELCLHSVDTGAAAAAALDQLGAILIDSGAAVRVDDPLPDVIGHELVVTQALANLISNAVKFVSPGVEPIVHVAAERRGPSIRISVDDNGIGVAPAHHQDIFELFVRDVGAGGYDGSGMGLAIAAKGIERIGGRIGVESTPDRGSRFWIELPAASVDADAACGRLAACL